MTGMQKPLCMTTSRLKRCMNTHSWIAEPCRHACTEPASPMTSVLPSQGCLHRYHMAAPQQACVPLFDWPSLFPLPSLKRHCWAFRQWMYTPMRLQVNCRLYHNHFHPHCPVDRHKDVHEQLTSRRAQQAVSTPKGRLYSDHTDAWPSSFCSSARASQTCFMALQSA